MKKIVHYFAVVNEWIALKTVFALGTMWCVYIFLFWCLIPLVFPASQTFVFYVSGGIIQLICLPLILVSQNIMGRKVEARVQQDHNLLMAQFGEINQMHDDLKILLDEIREHITHKEKTDSEK